MNCTVTTGINPNDHTFRLCGEPAVTSFENADGRIYAECAEHAPKSAPRFNFKERARVGDTCPVQRHGKVYEGRVTRVTRNGTVYARVRYNNGVEREVRV